MLPRHRLFTTQAGSSQEQPEKFSLTEFFPGFAAAAEYRFPPSPSRKKWYLEWPVAFLLHAAIIALALISFEPRMSLSPPSQTPVSVVFENTGTQQAQTPPTPRQGPPTTAEAPPSSSPPPPQPAQPQDQQLETNLEIPQDLFSQLPLPPPSSQPQPAHHARPAPHHYVPHPQYQVMNGMSLGNQSSPNAQPPMPNGFHGLNMQLSQSDLHSMEAPVIYVKWVLL